MIINVPRVFLKRFFKGIVEQAKAEGMTHISPEFMARVTNTGDADKEN